MGGARSLINHRIQPDGNCRAHPASTGASARAQRSTIPRRKGAAYKRGAGFSEDLWAGNPCVPDHAAVAL